MEAQGASQAAGAITMTVGAPARTTDEAPSGVQSFESVLRRELILEGPPREAALPVVGSVVLPTTMSPGELAMRLRYTPTSATSAGVQSAALDGPAVSRPGAAMALPPPDMRTSISAGAAWSGQPATWNIQSQAPPSLNGALHWQVGVRQQPLPAAPSERFDMMRGRLERALPSQASTLDIRVTNGGREVKQTPERKMWHGPMNGRKIAEGVRRVRRGEIGWAEMVDFLGLARPRLDRLVARWNNLVVPRSPRVKVADALGQLSTVLSGIERAVNDKDASALLGCEANAKQADHSLQTARGRA